MANYVGQNITGSNLSTQNLTGVDFTNANATNVNFTNAIITNAIFKNTLITGATLTGITFSNVQKGHLLLRAANYTNSAVNNLTSLTPAEFRIIQPAVGTDTIARISTVTVKIPNSQGEGYTVSVTPVISQLVCIFVATSQNIIITTGGTQIRTIRSNGTVVQDVSNVNTTLNYLKIDSISYRLTVGNGDGVIAMIPVDLNVYQVNGSGLGDIVSLNVGSASTTLNMNNNGITNVSSIQGWNVKEITAGTGIGVTATNGSYAITNSAVVRDISAGTGITVSTTGGVATLQNSGILSVASGTGISVGTTNGVAVVTNTGPTQVAVAQTIRDETQSLVEIGALPRKPNDWATNWVVADSTARNHNDMYVSVDGKIIASASPVNASNGFIRYSTDYGTTFGDGNTIWNWQTICGTSQGSRLFAISSTFGSANSTTLWQSTTQGATWTQISSPGFSSDAYIHRMRCSGDGTYLTATDLNASNYGRYYTSSNSGTTWTARTLSASAGNTNSVCLSRSGSIQYITWATSGNTNTAIYRSFDYGVTFTLVQGHIADGRYWRRIECDATGRFVLAARYLDVSTAAASTYRSDDYGATWAATTLNGVEDIWISATGQFVAGVSNPQTVVSYVVYSSDYGRNFTGVNMTTATGSTTTFRSLNGSGDGSVLVLGSINFTDGVFAGTGFIRVARQQISYNWDNNIYSGIITAVGFINPTLPQSLDLNTYSYEVAIDCYMNANPGTWIALGFNEIVNNSAQDVNHYAINVGWYGAGQQAVTTLYYQHNTYVNIASDTYVGEKQIRFILEKYIDPKNGVKGVRAVGTYDSFYKTDATTPNAVDSANKQFFTKYVVGLPFISTVIDNVQTTTISPITYICLGTTNVACITHYRIRTRKYSQVASG